MYYTRVYELIVSAMMLFVCEGYRFAFVLPQLVHVMHGRRTAPCMSKAINAGRCGHFFRLADLCSVGYFFDRHARFNGCFRRASPVSGSRWPSFPSRSIVFVRPRVRMLKPSIVWSPFLFSHVIHPFIFSSRNSTALASPSQPSIAERAHPPRPSARRGLPPKNVPSTKIKSSKRPSPFAF